MDMDIDFVRYSISDAAIARFVRRMSKAMPNVEIKMLGSPVELKHEDYHGKRIYIFVKDTSVIRGIRTKVDIGIHANDELKQINFAFPIGSGEGRVPTCPQEKEEAIVEAFKHFGLI